MTFPTALYKWLIGISCRYTNKKGILHLNNMHIPAALLGELLNQISWFTGLGHRVCIMVEFFNRNCKRFGDIFSFSHYSFSLQVTLRPADDRWINQSYCRNVVNILLYNSYGLLYYKSGPHRWTGEKTVHKIGNFKTLVHFTVGLRNTPFLLVTTNSNSITEETVGQNKVQRPRNHSIYNLYGSHWWMNGKIMWTTRRFW